MRRAIYNIDNNVKMILKACPLFVPIAEEGWQNTDIAKLTAEKYLSDLKDSDIDALVMACTHYPLLEQTIKEVMGEEIRLVNPAYETAKVLEQMINSNGLKNKNPHKALYKYYVSDNPVKFKKVGENFLNKPIGWVEKIDIERY